MKKKILALLMIMFVITGCGIDEKKTVDKKNDIESAEEEQVDDNKKDKDQEIDDFNDFVEVTFEHKDYPKIEDEKPDYSGVYCIDNYSTTYGCCNLIKQVDGSYYCYIYLYRVFIFETKAEYKSDNVLKIVDDNISGTINVEDYKVEVSIVDEYGHKYNQEYVNCKYDYSDISMYTGTYTYKKADGSTVTLTVGYNENREPFVTCEDGDETVEFIHNPSDYSIFVLDDKNYGDILYASIKRKVWGPDSEVFSFAQGYGGDKYLAIRFEGTTPYVYYKTYNPEVMH